MSETNSRNKEIFIRNFNRYLEMSGKKKIDISRAIGVSTGLISDWTVGRSYPRMDKIQLLAEFFGVTKSDLVEDVNIAKDTITDDDQKVLDLFHEVPKEKRDFVLAMIRAAIDNL